MIIQAPLIHYCLRYSEIEKSEKKSKLYNLVYGKPYPDGSTNTLLSAYTCGEKLAEQFRERLVERSDGDSIESHVNPGHLSRTPQRSQNFISKAEK